MMNAGVDEASPWWTLGAILKLHSTMQIANKFLQISHIELLLISY